MARPPEHTVVVTVLEGQYLMKKPNAKVYIQCQFNNEILSTEPVDHSTNPIFDTELAWDIDTKALSYLRSQRAALKLVVYSVTSTNARHSLGYLVLELRAAPSSGMEREEWHPLVNAKYSGPFRPEIKLIFAVKPKGAPRVDQDEAEFLEGRSPRMSGPPGSGSPKRMREKPKAEQKKKATLPVPVITTKSSIIPPTPAFSIGVNLADDGYWQVGHGDSLWTLCITIAFAENLDLLPDHALSHSRSLENVALGEGSGGTKQLDGTGDARRYYFTFYLLGDEIKSEAFNQLREANIQPELISMRLRGSEDDIRSFIRELSGLTIYLCCGDQILGFADVPLGPLQEGADDGHSKLEGSFRTVERMYNMYSLRQELPLSSRGKRPSLGLSMSIEHGHRPQPAETDEINAMTNLAGLKEDTLLVGEDPPVRATTPHDDRSAPPDMSIMSPIIRPVAHSPPIRSTAGRPREPAARPQSSPARTLGISGTNAASPRSGLDPLTPWQQYRFSIDLRSVRDFQLKSSSIYLKYTYPPFGSTSPVLTRPPVTIAKSHHEILLPHAFCAFEFVMAPDRLQTYLEAIPLVVEMWERDKFARDLIIGSAHVDLAEVWKQREAEEEVGIGIGIGAKAKLRSLDKWAIVSPEPGGLIKKVADLRLILALEDFGPVDEAHVTSETRVQQHQPAVPESRSPQVSPTPSDTSRRKPRTYSHSSISASVAPSLSHNSPALTSLHSTSEYKVALEHELWRAEEERKFRIHLRTREKELLDQLAREWTARERERESDVKRKVEEFRTFEQKLQDLAEQLETRDRKLKEAELAWEQRRDEIERESRRVVDEARDGARRIADEYKHRLQVEKGRGADYQRQRDEAIAGEQVAKRRLAEAQETLADLKRTLMAEPTPGSLQHRVQMLEKSLSQSEAKLTEEKRGRRYYKGQWVRALKELAACRKRWTEDVERRLDQKENPLSGGRGGDQQPAHVRAQPSELEHDILSDIKRGLEELKLRTSKGSKDVIGQSSSRPDDRGPTYDRREHLDAAEAAAAPPRPKLDAGVLAEVERLAGERDSLLSTGVYTREDRLIRELDARVRELLGSGRGSDDPFTA